jgi:uncharacterized membrane protein YczE
MQLTNPPIFETLTIAGAILAAFNVVETPSPLTMKLLVFVVGCIMLGFGLYGLVTS